MRVGTESENEEEKSGENEEHGERTDGAEGVDVGFKLGYEEEEDNDIHGDIKLHEYVD